MTKVSDHGEEVFVFTFSPHAHIFSDDINHGLKESATLHQYMHTYKKYLGFLSSPLLKEEEKQL